MLHGVGVGLRARHYRNFLEEHPSVDWLEVHTENYLQPGGLDRHVLLQLREHYPLSFHGVGLGLGSARGFSETHLMRIVSLVQALEPAQVSEHLCWGATSERALHDLLPIPLTHELLALVCSRVDRLQSLLKRPILLENVSAYLRHQGDELTEISFLNTVAQRTGCGILLDVNNLYVNQCNLGEDAEAAIAQVLAPRVGEIHLAGHLRSGNVVVDHHGDVVADPVWRLYQQALNRLGAVPTLIEWDTDVPELSVLLDQARQAQQHMQGAMPSSLTLRPLPHRQGVPDLSGSAHRQASFAQALLETGTPEGLRAPDVQLAERFGRYRSQLVSTWVKGLEAAYPVLKRLVGEDFFTGLGAAYGRAFPSSDPDLNAWGQHFATFLEKFEPVQAWPYFPAMARLEWALHRAYFAAELEPLSPAAFVALEPSALEAMHFCLLPTCALVSSAFSVGALWRAHQTEGEVVFPSLDAPSYLLVSRVGFWPQLVDLEPSTYAFLEGLEQGHSFGEAVDLALTAAELSGETLALSTLLTRCLGFGCLRQVVQPSPG
ncbi:MAG: DUF692 family multinuclear iron-containing protein [Myxococcota bacterium]